jgi:probable addiction module antidote protein
MTKLHNYQAWKLKKLNNPIFAAHYLNEIKDSSPELILSAIQNVVRARDVSTVAKEAGVARENIYRAFTEQGNPTFTTFWEVLKAVGVKFNFEPITIMAPVPNPSQPSPSQGGLNSSQLSNQSSASSLGGLGSSNGDVLVGVYRVNVKAPEFARGIGQQRKPMRSEDGQSEVHWNQQIR